MGLKMAQRRNELAERAVVILATAFVVMGGLIASLFLIVVNSTTPTQTVIYFSAGCLAVGILLWMLRERDPLTPRASVFTWFSRPKATTFQYKLKVRKSRSSQNQEPQQPPTAAQVREMKQEALGTWVPSKSPKKKPLPEPEPEE